MRSLGGGSQASQEAIDMLTHRISNKILHEPSVRLKAHEANGNGLSYADVIRDVFALDE